MGNNSVLACMKLRIACVAISCVFLKCSDLFLSVCSGDVLQRYDPGQCRQTGARTGWQQVWGDHLPSDLRIPGWERRYNKWSLYFLSAFCSNPSAVHSALSAWLSAPLLWPFDSLSSLVFLSLPLCPFPLLFSLSLSHLSYSCLAVSKHLSVRPLTHTCMVCLCLIWFFVWKAIYYHALRCAQHQLSKSSTES